jgi:hypothetical protein
VPSEWISEQPQLVQSYSYDLTDSANHPDVVFWRTLWELFTQRLEDVLVTGEPITREWLNHEGRAAALEAAERSDDCYWRDRLFQFVRVYPGLNSPDIRGGIEAAVLASQENALFQEQLPAIARRLRRDENEDINAIARLLGVDRRTVDRWLAAA